MNELINDILVERQRQIKKWGEQRHHDERWLNILIEEVGEAAEQILEKERPLYYEVVQIAAVALAWMEDLKHGQEYIQCPKCSHKSYNENDIKEKYCGNCHQFHEFLEPNDVSTPPKT